MELMTEATLANLSCHEYFNDLHLSVTKTAAILNYNIGLPFMSPVLVDRH